MKYMQDLPQQISSDDQVVTELIALTTQFELEESAKRSASPAPFFHPYNAQFALGNVKWW